MKKLFLLRHARTEDKQSGQKDIERELTAVGLQNATRMGMNFKKKQIQFDIIICSPAERAKTTALLIAEQIKYDTSRIHYNEEIYEASARTLLQVVNQLKDEWKQVLLVGHNPSISYLAEYITQQNIGDIITCGVVEISLEIEHWSEISEGTGELVRYEYPELLNF
ncbi:MAG: SixA phosphatase family protein [Candidatus Cyclobacteriaceae bacterium M2_1C_046]